MNDRIAKRATIAGAVAALVLSAGCARIQDMDTIEAEVAALKSELAAAQSEAAEATARAQSEAEAARAAAGDAASAADSAMSAASDAQASGAANAEKIDRMFEKVMSK